jgi:hypothetical protein
MLTRARAKNAVGARCLFCPNGRTIKCSMGGPHTQSVWSARRQIPTHQSNSIKWSPSDDRRVDRRTPIFRLESPLKTCSKLLDHDDGQQKAPHIGPYILFHFKSVRFCWLPKNLDGKILCWTIYWSEIIKCIGYAYLFCTFISMCSNK